MSLKKHIRLNNELAGGAGVVKSINDTAWCLAIKLPAVEPVVDGVSSGSMSVLESNAYMNIHTKRIMAVLVPKENTLTDLLVQYNEDQLFYELLMNTRPVRLLIQAAASKVRKLAAFWWNLLDSFRNNRQVWTDLVWQLSASFKTPVQQKNINKRESLKLTLWHHLIQTQIAAHSVFVNSIAPTKATLFRSAHLATFILNHTTDLHSFVKII